QAVTLMPDMELAHAALKELYSRLGYRDLVLKHMTEEIRLSKRAGPRVGESEKDYIERVKNMEEVHKQWDKGVKDDQNKFAVKAGGGTMRPHQKAVAALQLGLVDQALDILTASDSLEFGVEGAKLELDLLLSVGRIRDLRTMVAPDDPAERQMMDENLRKVG